jgi:membrane associated rhomboid family serine protease
MATPLFAVLVLAGAALYFMNPAERLRLMQTIVGAIRRAAYASTHVPAGDAFDEFLRARTRWAIATPVLLTATVLVAIGNPAAIEKWGNLATQTTNGQWWRVMTATFVHAGLLHVAMTVAAVAGIGGILERAVGRVAFAVVYLSAGLVAGVVSLWTASPTAVTFGSSGAVFGMSGLLLAVMANAFLAPPPFPLPWMLAKRVAVTAVPFLLYSLATDHLSTTSEMAGLGTGLVAGLIVARGVAHEKPSLHRAGALTAVSALIAFGAVMPLEGLIDVRPEIEKVVAVETRTAGAYDDAAAKFRIGRLPAKALVQVIDVSILPDLQAARARLEELRGVPREHAPMVAAAQQYVQLREQSWRARAEGLRKSKMDLLRKAEASERAALDAFEKMRSISVKEM